MENFLLSLEVVAPLFFMMLLGYAIRHRQFVDRHAQDVMNKLVFQIFLPLLLFRNVYESDLSHAVNPLLILLAIVGTIVTFIILCALVKRFEPVQSKRGVLVQGTFRSNCALFGMPVAISICGEGNVAVVAVMLAAIVLVFNALAVLALELFRGGKPNWKEIATNIAKNPLIIGVAAGLAANLLQIKIPSLLYSAITDLSRVATPLSFVVLGTSFTFASAKQNRKRIALAVAGKLVLIPIVWLSIGVAMGFRNQALVALMVVMASPTSVSSYPMARAMGGDCALAGEIIVFTSILSILTMFLWIFAFKEFGLI